MPSDLTAIDLIARIDRQREQLDGNLRSPARWRGPIRRELSGRSYPAESARVCAAFNSLFERPTTPEPRSLIELNRAIGGGGFRAGGMKVGGSSGFPAAQQIERLTSDALQKAESREPAALRAARLHLDLLLIHPFRDGNGRTARLAASAILLRSGFRSTLFTAVEQHSATTPEDYPAIFARYRAGKISYDDSIRRILAQMLSNSAFASWFRSRTARLEELCEEAGIRGDNRVAELRGFEFAECCRGKTLRRMAAGREDPWKTLRDRLSAGQRAALSWQLTRIRTEEQDIGLPAKNV